MHVRHTSFDTRDLDAAFADLASLVDQYAAWQPQPLPMTTVAALKEICTLMEEIELYQRESSSPEHHEVPWRVAHLMLCISVMEQSGLRDGAARSLAHHLLDALGVSLAAALELASVRLRHLCHGDDMEHVDRHVLVPVMRRHLRRS